MEQLAVNEAPLCFQAYFKTPSMLSEKEMLSTEFFVFGEENSFRTRADLGGRRVVYAPLRDSPTHQPKGHPFRASILDRATLSFSKALLASIYTNFEGERSPKNAVFYKKNSKTAQDLFFFILAAPQTFLLEIWPFSMFSECSKNQSGRPIKNSLKFSKNF